MVEVFCIRAGKSILYKKLTFMHNIVKISAYKRN